MYFTLLVVVILTAIALVAVALGIARAISPRSYNPQKGEAYECGIPTRGRSWMQFKVGYYLFAILFLMFDVETVFLFSWAVVVQDLGVYGLVSILFFLIVLVLGLAYAWRKGSFGMEVRNPRIKSMKFEGLQRQRVHRVDGPRVARERHERRHGVPRRGGRVGPQQQPLAADLCDELLRHRVHGCGRRRATILPGLGLKWPGPPRRQADFIMVAGTITHKMAPVLKRLYDQMADPKYVIATAAAPSAAAARSRSRTMWSTA